MNRSLCLLCALFAAPLLRGETVLSFPITGGSADAELNTSPVEGGQELLGGNIDFTAFGPNISFAVSANYVGIGQFFPAGEPLPPNAFQFDKGENAELMVDITVGSVSGSFLLDSLAPGFADADFFSQVVVPSTIGENGITVEVPFTATTRFFWPDFLNGDEIDMYGHGMETFHFDPIGIDTAHFDFEPVPEPENWVLTTLGLMSVCVGHWRREKGAV